ncbi:cilia- and flagella-associated protein 53 isoform X2 [Gopherus evgoodei]|uniref:cilia- and flagella-associated protein 53 isoform X2 n=1 Tax=Gopherus evgoodei TaxID=1825980 RepID=UPI0011CF6EB7|nr:cilia- and flagella-associated protein 53 isoform X2 [Gopherus evgoodei]
MLGQWSRRPREVTGPTPHSVALRAKFPKPDKSECFILECRRKEKERLEYLAFTKVHNRGLQVCQWENHNERRRLHSIVQKKVDQTMQEYLAGTEDRRERLRALLEAEEKSYFTEMESMEETMLEREAKMRERAKVLREKREEERQKLVALKREQQFREQCEEVRLQWSQRHQREVCSDRLAQLALKEELKKQEKREEQIFAELWEEDRLAKEKRGIEDFQKKSEQNQELLNVLNAQVAALDAQKEEAKRLKEEEAQLVQELFKEQQMYREYLAQQLEEEIRREKEMDKLLEEEMEKSWTKKAEQMRLEKEARKRLMKDVLDTRRLQIEEKLERNAKQQEELAQDKKLLAEAIKELNSIEKEKYLRRMQEAKAYREQLQAQITYQKQAHIAEEEEKQREYESGLAAERVYQEKMKDILSRPYMKLAEIHPLRRKLMSNLQV